MSKNTVINNLCMSNNKFDDKELLFDFHSNNKLLNLDLSRCNIISAFIFEFEFVKLKSLNLSNLKFDKINTNLINSFLSKSKFLSNLNLCSKEIKSQVKIKIRL